MHWAILAGLGGVEHHAWVDPVFGVDVAAGPGGSAGAEVLPIRGGVGAVAPYGGKRVLVVCLNDHGARGGIIVLVDVPLRLVDQMVVAQPACRVGHPRQTQIGAVGQDCREQGRHVGCWVAGAQVGEAVGKAGELGDVAHHLRHPHPWQYAIQPPS